MSPSESSESDSDDSDDKKGEIRLSVKQLVVFTILGFKEGIRRFAQYFIEKLLRLIQ